MESLKQRLLDYYGLTEDDYISFSKEPSFSLFPRIDDEPSVKEGKALIEASLEARQKILIYGDYDADGILATSILTRTFLLLHHHVSFFIPSRYTDGYGLNMENAQKILKSGYGLVILVDNGVSCFDEVAYLRQNGVNVLIIDHHELPSSLPPANAIIHDGLLHYGDARISAGCLSFLFSITLLGVIDPYLLTLGAISLITDLMPIKGQNRVVVGLALRKIRELEFPEIMMLTKHRYIDERVLGIEIGPKINAIGRMLKAHECQKLVHYFAELEAKDKNKTAFWAEEINTSRRNKANEAEASLRVDDTVPGIILKANILEGLNGMLAGRLLDKYNKPVIVLSESSLNKEELVGSFRCKEGCSFLLFQEEAASFFLRSGGHPFAGGLTIRKKDYDEFARFFLSFASNHPHVEKKEKAIELLPSEINMDSYRLIRKFGPFGKDFEEPKFIIRDFPVENIVFSKMGTSVRTEISQGNYLVAFKVSKEDIIGDRVSFKGNLHLNEFNGRIYVEFQGKMVLEMEEKA